MSACWMDEAGMAKLAEMDDRHERRHTSVRSGTRRRRGECTLRTDHTVFVLINLWQDPQTVKLPDAMQNVLQGGSVQSVQLPRYGVSVLSEAKH